MDNADTPLGLGADQLGFLYKNVLTDWSPPFLYRCWESCYVLFLKILCFLSPAFWPTKKLQKVAGAAIKILATAAKTPNHHKLARWHGQCSSATLCSDMWWLDGAFATLLLTHFNKGPRPIFFFLHGCSVEIFCRYDFRCKVFSHFVSILYGMGVIVSWGWFLKGPDN